MTKSRAAFTLISSLALFAGLIFTIPAQEDTGSSTLNNPDTNKFLPGRPGRVYAPGYTGPEDTDTVSPWKTRSLPETRNLPDGRTITEITLPSGAEPVPTLYSFTGAWDKKGLVYTLGGKYYFQLEEKSYGPFTQIYRTGLFDGPEEHFYIWFRWDNKYGYFRADLCLDGRVFPQGIGFPRNSAASTWGAFLYNPENNSLVQHFQYPNRADPSRAARIRAGEKVYGPYSGVKRIYTSPSFDHWFAEVTIDKEPYIIIDGELKEQNDYSGFTFRTSEDKTHWSYTVMEGGREALYIDGVLRGRYEDVHQPQLTNDGRFSYAFKENGRWWFNVNGNVFEVPGAYGSPVFLKDSDEYVYQTVNTTGSGFFIHAGDRTWGPYTKLEGTSRWTGEGWLHGAAVSYDGSHVAFQFQTDEEHQYVQINDRTYGPYWTAWGPYISPDGKDIGFRYTDYEEGHWVWWNGTAYGPYTDTGAPQSASLEVNFDFYTDSSGNITGFRYNRGGEKKYGITNTGGIMSWGNTIAGGKNFVFTPEKTYGPYKEIMDFIRTADGLHKAIHWTNDEGTWLTVNEWERGPNIDTFELDEEESLVRILSHRGEKIIVETIPLELTLIPERPSGQ